MIIWTYLFQKLTLFRLDCSMDFSLKTKRKAVTSVRKIISLDPSLDKYFHQIDSIYFELIALIELKTGNNFSCWNASETTRTITGLTVYNYKKREPKLWKYSGTGFHKSTNREEYSCVLPTISIPKDMVRTDIEKWSEWGSHPKFLSAEAFAKNPLGLYHVGKNVRQPLHPWTILFSIIKRCRTYTWHATSSNKTLYQIYKQLELNPQQVTAIYCLDQ